MPLPFILGAVAAFAGVAGVGSGIAGAVKMKDANDVIEGSKQICEESQKKFERENKKTCKKMDELGEAELKVLESFKAFSETYERILNKPKFKEYNIEGVKLPQYDGEKLKEVSVGAGVLLGGLGGAGLGAAGGFAAAGATTSAVMALGTASTGTAIATLHGAALTNATLAAIGGIGTVSGGGVALGTTILGATTLGVGLLVGGVIFNFTGSKLSDKASQAASQACEIRDKVNKICDYLSELYEAAQEYYNSLNKVKEIYDSHLGKLMYLVNVEGCTDWNKFTAEEKLNTENTVHLVALLYDMCKVNLVLKNDDSEGINEINRVAIDDSINKADKVLEKIN